MDNLDTGYGDGFPKVKLECTCPKNKETGQKECGWSYEGEVIATEGIYCVGGSDTTTTKKTTKPTDSTGVSTTTKTTGDTTTTKTTKTTTTKATTTTKTTTTKATTASTAGTTAAPGTECNPKADGTCGNASNIESYLFVNFENEAFNGAKPVSNDPHLVHLDHIGTDGFVGAGSGLDNSWSKAESVVVRVDRCPNLSDYSNVNNVDLVTPSGTANCKNDYTWAYKSTYSKNNRLGYVATSPDGTYVIAAGAKEKNNQAIARWLIKLDAQTGVVIWEVEMPNNNSDSLSGKKQSGYESIAFTVDGGFITGRWANY